MVHSERTVDPSGHVLLGVDQTDGAQHALEWTASLGRRLDLTIDVLHARSPWLGLEMALPPFDFDRYRAGVERTVQDWAAKLTDVKHETRILEDDPAHAILTVASETDPTLIVLGSHGSGRWAPRVLGSVTSKVLHHADRPIVVVPREAALQAPHGRIVVGIDGSPASLKALRWACSFAGALAAEVYAVCAVPYEPYAEKPRLAELDSADPVGDTLAALRALTAQIERESDMTITSDVLIGEPKSQLLAASRADDMLVVGATGHGTFSSAFLGSTSHACATHSDVPTVVVP